jgi:hypothetical protein
VTRLPAFDVNVTVYRGRITRDELIEHFGALAPEDAASADRWISYFDPSADLSAVDIAALAEIKRISFARVAELWGPGRLASAMVCESALCEPVLGVWRDYLGSDPRYPAAPSLFSSLGAACDWLRLAEPAREAISAVIEGEDSAAPAERPREVTAPAFIDRGRPRP